MLHTTPSIIREQPNPMLTGSDIILKNECHSCESNNKNLIYMDVQRDELISFVIQSNIESATKH